MSPGCGSVEVCHRCSAANRPGRRFPCYTRNCYSRNFFHSTNFAAKPFLTSSNWAFWYWLSCSSRSTRRSVSYTHLDVYKRQVEDHVASPTFAPLLAARSLDLVERDQAGLFHIGGGTPISWFDFARTIFDIAGLKPHLQATNEREYRTPARRPKYSALSNAKMERAGLDPMPPLRAALETYFAQRGGQPSALSH